MNLFNPLNWEAGQGNFNLGDQGAMGPGFGASYNFNPFGQVAQAGIGNPGAYGGQSPTMFGGSNPLTDNPYGVSSPYTNNGFGSLFDSLISPFMDERQAMQDDMSGGIGGDVMGGIVNDTMAPNDIPAWGKTSNEITPGNQRFWDLAQRNRNGSGGWSLSGMGGNNS